MILPLLTAVSIWLSAGIVLGGDTGRIAALPSIWTLIALLLAATVAARTLKLRASHTWPLAISVLLWLPYLPIPIPPAFLIWEGPVEVIVWIAVAVGLLIAVPIRVPSVFVSPSSAPWIAAIFMAVSSAIVFSQVRAVIPGGDEPHYLAATQSLLHDGDLKVANNYAAGEYLDYFPGRLEPHFLKRSTSGEIYSIHAPGVSVIVLPLFALAGYLGAVATMIAFASASAMLMWRIAFTVTSSAAAAWAGVAGVALSAPFFFHTFTIYPEIVGGFCVLAGVWLLIELEQRREPRERTLLAIGAALATLPWLHSRFAVLAGVIGSLVLSRLLARASSLRKTAVFLSVPAVAGAAWLAFFHLIWGTLSPTAPYGPDTSTSPDYIWRGLIGLLFDQQFGVLTTAPIYAIAVIGVAMIYRSRQRLALELAYIAVPYAITVASYAMWWGGAAAPARFVVAILPLAAIPIAVAFARSTSLRAFVLVLLVVSAGVLLPRAFEDGGRFIYNNRSGVDATLRWLTSATDLPAALPSVHATGGSIAVRDGAIWLGVFVGLLAIASRRLQAMAPGVRFSAATWSLAIAVMFCTTVAWRLDAAPSLDASRSKLAVLDRFRPSWQSTIMRLPWPHLLSADAFLAAMPIAMPGSRVTLDRVPAGDYVVSAKPSTTVGGSVAISVGRNDAPIAVPALDDLRNAHSPFHLRLPVMARTLNFRVEAAEPAELVLQPVAVVPRANRSAAIRAARFGHTRAFFFDDWLYPERDGFWTRANGAAHVVLTTDEGTRLSGLPIAITAGAAPTRVTLSTGSWEESFDLAAGQKQDVMLPPANNGTWPLRVRSGPGFRPSERDAASQDVRELAAWIAIY